MRATLPRLALFVLCLLQSAVLLAAPAVTVNIEGISGELLTNAQQWLTIYQQREHPLLTEGRIDRLFNKADQEIENALQPYGYYRPHIEKSLIHKSGEQWVATYRIEPGEPLRIATLDWRIDGDAVDDKVFQKLWGTFPLHEGNILNQALYEQSKHDLLKLANERGYFDAEFTTARITIDLKSYSADVVLHFNSGRRYLFGDTELNQDVLDDGLLHRYLSYHKGDPYDIDKLLDLQQGLMGSDYFESVELQPQSPNHTTGSVPVVVNMTPRKRNRYTLAFGYGTDTGPRGKLGWAVPRVNRRGHRFESEYSASGIGNSLNLRYRIPIRDPRREEIIFNGGLANTRLETSESRIATVGASLLQVQGPWQETLSLNYHNEVYTIANVERHTILVMPGISVSRHISSRYVLVDQGLLLNGEVRGGAKGALSDINFFQGKIHVKGITSLGEKQRLITRGTFGGTNTDNFDRLPASLRFYTGGAQTVRGYRYQSLGPTDSQGNVIGGKYLLIGSAEYERRINQDWSWALFIDGGNAMNDLSTPLKQGAGIGVRWQTPVGPLRFDIAWAISEPGNPKRPHISIGPDL